MSLFNSKKFNNIKFRLGKNRSQALEEREQEEIKSGDLDRRLVFGLSSSRWPSLSQLKYLPRVLSANERKIINWLSLFAVALLVFIGARYYQRHVVIEPAYGGEYTEALIGAPQYINPLYSQTNDVDQDIVALIYSSMFRVDPASGLVPDLVKEYEISEDQKTYTFTIRDDVRWHDGETLTTNDILFTVQAIQNSLYRSPLQTSLKSVETNKIDDYKFSLTLSEPFAPFLSNLTFGVLPEHIWGNVEVNNVLLVEYNLKPIGSGPFKFESLTRDRTGIIKSYNIVPNESYYFDAPYISKIIFRFYPDLTTAAEALKNKSVEGISFLTQEQKEDLNKASVNFHSLGLPQYTALFFHQKNNERLKDLNVRSALDRAIDKERIVREVLGGDGTVVNTPVLPGFLGHNPNIDVRSYDPKMAASILDEAGWKLPEDGNIRIKDGSELAFSLTTVDQPQFNATAELIKEFWEAVGARVEVITVSSSQAQRDIIKPRKYDILLYGEIIGIDPDPFPFWHSSQQTDPGQALAIFFDKQADKVLEQARQTSDIEQRNLKYMEFQNILAEEIPAVFLNSPLYTYGLAKKVKGFTLENITVPSDRFTNVTDWYIKTKRGWQ